MTKFTRIGIAAIAGAAITCSAQAADLRRPITKAPPPAPVTSWSGCYIGGQLGGQWASFTGDVRYPGDAFGHPAVTASRDFNSNDGNFLYGAQIGCNWQPTVSGFVLGVEADVAGINRNDGAGVEIFRFAAPVATDHFNTTGRFGTQASLRLRGGLTFDRMMLYVAGGVSWARISATHSFIRDGDGSLVFDSSADRTGWNIGAGLEFMLANTWTLGLEYRYTDYGSRNFTVPAGTAGTLSWTTFTVSADNLRTQDVRLRLNYLFNSGPVMARY
jgi:outer membrane immunogenic protein